LVDIDTEGPAAKLGSFKAIDDVLRIFLRDIDESMFGEEGDFSERTIRDAALTVDHAREIARFDVLGFSEIHEEAGHAFGVIASGFVTAFSSSALISFETIGAALTFFVTPVGALTLVGEGFFLAVFIDGLPFASGRLPQEGDGGVGNICCGVALFEQAVEIAAVVTLITFFKTLAHSFEEVVSAFSFDLFLAGNTLAADGLTGKFFDSLEAVNVPARVPRHRYQVHAQPRRSRQGARLVPRGID